MPDGSTVTFSDDTKLDVGSVIWATGFRLDHNWIDAPVFDAGGRVVHERGVTESRGLYFIGLPWQHTRGSALLGFVKDDAEFLAGRISAARAPEPRDDFDRDEERMSGTDDFPTDEVGFPRPGPRR